MKDKRKGFEEKLDAQLLEWNAQMDLLKAKAVTATVGIIFTRVPGSALFREHCLFQ
jgi:hypothetical protein